MIFVEAILTNFKEGLCHGNKKNKIRMNDDTIRKRLRVYVSIARETCLYEKLVTDSKIIIVNVITIQAQ